MGLNPFFSRFHDFDDENTNKDKNVYIIGSNENFVDWLLVHKN